MNCADGTKIEKSKIVVTCPYMEVYIPMKYFENGFAEDFGSTINTLGVINARAFDAQDKPGKLELLNFPTKINLFPNSTENKSLTLIKEAGEQKYKLCKFFKGDILCNAVAVSDSGSSESFVNTILRGNLPNTIPYKEVKKIWDDNLNINKVNLNVPSVIKEILLMASYRNKTAKEEEFSRVIGANPNTSQFGYETANMREICARTSTFTAITFEDLDTMIAISLNRNKYGKDEVESPIEKIIKY